MSDPGPDFLQKDYELKVRYLSDHYARMWTRFNFFMVANTAVVIALCKELIEGKPLIASLPLLSAAAVLALWWYIFGAQDRYLVEAYRTEIRKVAEAFPPGYLPVSDMSESHIEPELYQWRSKTFSTTKLAAWFPLSILLVLLSLIVYAFVCPCQIAAAVRVRSVPSILFSFPPCII